MEFQREIFKNSRYEQFGESRMDDDGKENYVEVLPFIKDELLPVMEEAGKYSSKIWFIISGRAYIMNREG